MKIKKKKGALMKTSTTTVTSISLPTRKTEPSNRLWDYVILLFGLKKIGKTSLCSELGDGFFIPWESGTKALSVYCPQDEKGNPRALTSDAKGWEEFREYVRLISKDKKFPFVVLDPVDKSFKACTKYVCKKLGIDHPSEGDWGKGYEAVRDEFTEQLDKLFSSGKGVILISHATEKTIKTRTGDSYDLITSTLPNQAREIIEGVVDIWSYYRYEGRQRVLQILGDELIGAGHRIRKHFRYTDGKRIRNIDMGSSESESAANFLAAFNNQLLNPKPKGGKLKVRIGKK